MYPVPCAHAGPLQASTIQCGVRCCWDSSHVQTTLSLFLLHIRVEPTLNSLGFPFCRVPGHLPICSCIPQLTQLQTPKLSSLLHLPHQHSRTLPNASAPIHTPHSACTPAVCLHVQHACEHRGERRVLHPAPAAVSTPEPPGVARSAPTPHPTSTDRCSVNA